MWNRGICAGGVLNCIVHQELDLLVLRLQLLQRALGEGSDTGKVSQVHHHALTAARQASLLQLSPCLLTPAQAYVPCKSTKLQGIGVWQAQC